MPTTGNRYTVPRNGYDSWRKIKKSSKARLRKSWLESRLKKLRQRVARVRVVGYAPVGGPLKAFASQQNPTCNVVLNVRDEDVRRKWPVFKGPVSS